MLELLGGNVMFSCTLRRGTLALLGLILVSLLGGCFQMKMGAEFRSDGTIAVSQEWTATNEFAMDKIREQRAEAQKIVSSFLCKRFCKCSNPKLQYQIG